MGMLLLRINKNLGVPLTGLFFSGLHFVSVFSDPGVFTAGQKILQRSEAWRRPDPSGERPNYYCLKL